jgi:GNAT superfamily N-acetyltransferase
VLGPHHVGHRVVVRRIVGMRDNRPLFTDVLGELVEYAETDITVRTRSGAVRVPKNEIVRAKPVPDRRRLSATEAVELAAAAGWPAGESARLGDWWLRATENWTMRGNSALPIGDPDRPLGEAIDAVSDWYQVRGQRPAFSVPLPLRARLDAELDRRGWVAQPTSLVMTAPLTELVLARRSEPVLLDREPSPDWLSVVAARKQALPASALAVLTGVPEVRFGKVYGGEGALAATARGVVADTERRWLGLSLIETAEGSRRQGYATHVIAALVDWARSVGARDAYLQVEARNTVAVGLYERLGFRVHHSFVPRVLP